MELKSLQDVFTEQLTDLYSAEAQLVEALPKVASAASSDELRKALDEHLEETRGHLQRLSDLLPTVGINSPSEKCEGMEGLIREGEKIISAQGDRWRRMRP